VSGMVERKLALCWLRASVTVSCVRCKIAVRCSEVVACGLLRSAWIARSQVLRRERDS
jgi:hypothetical protein